MKKLIVLLAIFVSFTAKAQFADTVISCKGLLYNCQITNVTQSFIDIAYLNADSVPATESMPITELAYCSNKQVTYKPCNVMFKDRPYQIFIHTIDGYKSIGILKEKSFKQKPKVKLNNINTELINTTNKTYEAGVLLRRGSNQMIGGIVLSGLSTVVSLVGVTGTTISKGLVIGGAVGNVIGLIMYISGISNIGDAGIMLMETQNSNLSFKQTETGSGLVLSF